MTSTAPIHVKKFSEIPSVAVLDGWSITVVAPTGYRETYQCPATHALKAAEFHELYRSKGWTVQSVQVWRMPSGPGVWLIG